jgi:SH3-like domain-containing protein
VTSDAAVDSTQTFTYETLTWVRVRSAPSVDAEVLATLAPGTRVEVASIGRGWLALRWEGRAGWVGASLLTRVR